MTTAQHDHIFVILIQTRGPQSGILETHTHTHAIHMSRLLHGTSCSDSLRILDWDFMFKYRFIFFQEKKKTCMAACSLLH